ncbi:secreted protein [Stemphylium lycopersici]|uniref:Secreted protein n=1 Tax=Stemphylium lycopersici TaxID=183478 RepID=A0A364NDZ0_STELY|nr:secreted protein [Stemphylium lycopersici]
MDSLFAIFTAILSVLSCTISATAVSGDYELSAGNHEISVDHMAVGHLEVIDPRFPGVTFAGTAQSVSEQIMALEPETLPDVDVDNMEIAQPRSLHGRSSINCNWGGAILGRKSCNDGSNALTELGSDKCCVRGELNHCALISCSYKCGVYLCNKRGTPFCAACSDIAKDMARIITQCDANSNAETPAGALDFDDHFVGIARTGSC